MWIFNMQNDEHKGRTNATLLYPPWPLVERAKRTKIFLQ